MEVSTLIGINLDSTWFGFVFFVFLFFFVFFLFLFCFFCFFLFFFYLFFVFFLFFNFDPILLQFSDFVLFFIFEKSPDEWDEALSKGHPILDCRNDYEFEVSFLPSPPSPLLIPFLSGWPF